MIRTPKIVYSYFIGWLNSKEIEKQFISKFFLEKNEFSKYKNEVEQSGLIEELNQKQQIFEKRIKGKTYRGNVYNMGAIGIKEGINLYGIIRKIKPEISVETGVCNGFSTAFILLALHKNRTGRLYSIDFPEVAGGSYEEGTFWEGKGGAVIPKGDGPGWLIPEYLKENWELILGKSQEKLPQLLKRLKKVDFFMHDSEHSYGCMWFEFNEAYKVLNKGGILVSDDINWNNSFYDFANKKNKDIIKIGEGIGFIRNI